MYYLGIDHHKRFSPVAVMNEEGKVKVNCKMANDKASFNVLKQSLDEPSKAVIEAGNNWGMLYDLLGDLEIDVTVADPLKVRAITDAKIKSDSIDANTLAHLLRANLIPEVHVPPREIREQKNLLCHRLWLVKLQTMIKNRIHQIIRRNQVRPPTVADLFGAMGTKFLESLALPAIDAKLLHGHLTLFEQIKEQIKRTEVWIDQNLKDNKLIPILHSLPGFGKTLSALVALEIDDINRFPTRLNLLPTLSLSPLPLLVEEGYTMETLFRQAVLGLSMHLLKLPGLTIRSSIYCRA